MGIYSTFRLLQSEFDQFLPRPGAGGDAIYRVGGDHLGHAAQVGRTHLEPGEGSLRSDLWQFAAGAADHALEHAMVIAERVAIDFNGIAIRLHRPFNVGAQLRVDVLGLFNRFEQVIGFVVKEKHELAGAFLCGKIHAVLAGRLRRAQTFLRGVGVEITFSREGRTGSRMIRVSTSVSSVSLVSAAHGNGSRGDQAMLAGME